MKRRDFIKGAIGISALTSLALYARGMMGDGMMGGPMGMMGGPRQMMRGFGGELKNWSSFPNPLKIPKEIFGVERGGVRHFDLNMQLGLSNFFPGVDTQTFGVNGSYLGPTIRLRVGQKVSLNWHNNIGEAASMHGHGMHLPAHADGTMHQTIPDGGSWSAKYTVKQKACTNWYHPHTMEKTATQVLMGLGGMILIDDANSLRLPLPKRYGIDDIPLIFQDRQFTQSGFFNYPRTMMTTMHGYRGDTLLVNGTIAPYIEAEAGLLRLRLLNASNSRVYSFGIEGRRVQLIAGDNSLLQRPITLRRVTLSPAERAEIVVNLKGLYGKKLYLKDYQSGARVLEIRVTKTPSARSSVPSILTHLEPLALKKVKRKRRFILSVRGPGRLLINGRAMDPNRIDQVVRKGEYEIWEVYNEPMGMGMMRMVHNFHMHGNHFRVLSRNGSKRAVKPWERGYKDTVLLEPGDRVELLVRHTDYSDAKVPYMFHCHILEHEDAGMMGQFTVV